jgi:uncharacterized membrane protein
MKMTQTIEKIKRNIQEKIYSTALNEVLAVKFYDDFVGDMYAKMRELAGAIAFALINVITMRIESDYCNVEGDDNV